MIHWWRRLAEFALYSSAPLALIITSPMLAQGLGPSGRGEFGLVQSVAALAMSLGMVGQAEVFLADLRRGSPPVALAASRMVASVGLSAAAVIAALSLVLLKSSPTAAVAGLILIPVLGHGQLWRASAISDGELVRLASNNAAGAVLRVLVISGLWLVGWINPASAIGAVQLSAAVATIVVLGKWRGSTNLSTRFADLSPEVIRKAARRGAPLLLFTGLTSITLHGDLVMLSFTLPPDGLGIFAGAAGLSISALSLSGFFKSRVQRAAFSSRPSRAVTHEFVVLVGLGVVGASLVAFGAPLVVNLLLGPGYEAATDVVRILAFAAAALLILDSVHGLLAVLGERAGMVWTAAVGASSTVTLLPILSNTGGIVGAAWASLVSYGLASTTGMALAARQLRL